MNDFSGVQISFPPVTTLDWVLATVVTLIVATLVIYAMLTPSEASRKKLLDFKNDLGMQTIPAPLVIFGIGIWGAIFVILVTGLTVTIVIAVKESFTNPVGINSALRGTLITITALTATLAAVVALPITVNRLHLTRR